MIVTWLKNLLGSRRDQSTASDLQNAFSEVFQDIDFDDVESRIGIQIYLTLAKQFEVIGKRQGEFPPVEPFASDAAQGALMGTAFAIVRSEIEGPTSQVLIDAVVTAFSLAFGKDIGKQMALSALEASAADNTVMNSASDWAIKDTSASLGSNSSSFPAAYLHAVEGRI